MIMYRRYSRGRFLMFWPALGRILNRRIDQPPGYVLLHTFHTYPVYRPWGCLHEIEFDVLGLSITRDSLLLQVSS
jgi:hypothetical protein